MKLYIQSKIKDFNKTYDKLEPKKQKLIMFAIFLSTSLIFAEFLLFKSIDKTSISQQEFLKLTEEKNKIAKENAAFLLEKAYKSDKNLEKTEATLKEEVSNLLKNSVNQNLTNPEQLQKTLENVIRQTNGLKMRSFKNKIPTQDKQDGQTSILIKHNFELVVNGGFQNIFDLISNIETINGIQVENFYIYKDKNNKLSAKIDFYVLNTSNHLIKF